MNRSEIFDEYVKIAKANGLISEAEDSPMHTSAPKFEKSEESKRPNYNKEDITNIEALYGYKSEEDKGFENIIERAHPESVVIAPSYDKINGLVENNNELHNILVNIIGRTPTGLLSYKKLAQNNAILKIQAQNDLVMELVRIANHLDNIGEDDLRLLADRCIEDINKKKSLNSINNKLTKTAFWPLLLGVVAGIAGVTYLVQHYNFNEIGDKITNALDKLNDLDHDSSNETFAAFFRDKLDSDAHNMIRKAISTLETLHPKINNFKTLIEQVEKPATLEELKAAANDPKVQDQIKDIKDYRDQIVDLITMLIEPKYGFVAHLADTDYRLQHTSEKNVIESIPLLGDAIEFGDKLLRGSEPWNIFTNKWADASLALKAVAEDLKKQLTVIKDADSVGELYQKRIAEQEKSEDSVNSDIDKEHSALNKDTPTTPTIPDTSALGLPEPTSPVVDNSGSSDNSTTVSDDDSIDFANIMN